MVRRLLAIVCFIATCLAALNPVLLREPFSDRTRLQAALTAMQEPRGFYPQYPRFLENVRNRTRRGDSIALFLPQMNWNGAYSHAYFRASYLLAGREVLPVISPENAPLPQNVARASYLAYWGPDGGRLVKK